MYLWNRFQFERERCYVYSIPSLVCIQIYKSGHVSHPRGQNGCAFRYFEARLFAFPTRLLHYLEGPDGRGQIAQLLLQLHPNCDSSICNSHTPLLSLFHFNCFSTTLVFFVSQLQFLCYFFLIILSLILTSPLFVSNYIVQRWVSYIMRFFSCSRWLLDSVIWVCVFLFSFLLPFMSRYDDLFIYLFIFC